MDTASGVLVGVWLAVVVSMFVLTIAGLGLSIWALIDAARRPDWQFETAGQNKVLWIVLPVVGIAACQLVGLVAAAIYLLSVRTQLDAAAGPPSRQEPPPPWGPPPG